MDSKAIDKSVESHGNTNELDHALSESNNTSASEATTNVDLMTEGVMSLLSPIVQEMDLRVLAVRSSQKELSKEMERLIAELEIFLHGNDPTAMQELIQRIIIARKKLAKTNQTLKNIQSRVQRIATKVEAHVASST